MDLNYTKVNYDGDLSEMSEDELRAIIEKFESAQESNVAEFERAAEKLDEIDSDEIAEYEEARQDLIGDVAEAEAFDAVPLSEDELAECSFGKLREWKEFVAEEAADSEDEEADGPDSDGEFEDMGQRGETNGGEDDDGAAFATETVSALSGVNVE